MQRNNAINNDTISLWKENLKLKKAWRHDVIRFFLKSFDTWCHFRVQFKSSSNLKIRFNSNRIEFKKKRNRFDLNRFLKLNSKVQIEFKSWTRNPTRRSIYIYAFTIFLKYLYFIKIFISRCLFMYVN